ncbi:MAG TPA: methyltransferase domain-containing protein [Candidatus Kapabacteria bacterium]|jgi:SAM-dependent methyltransferase|nr:methyltransferase domain-containing protein [Candidatus Kapabacteria bacterium]
MSWYRDWFLDANYSVVYEHRDDREAEQVIDLIEQTIGLERKRRVLDVGCGSGRHSILFALRGYSDVTGIDLSRSLLDEARNSAEKLRIAIQFLERDMRDLPKEKFDLAVNLFTSFGYFDKDEENASVIDSVGEVLNRGGYFVIDFLNSHFVREHLVAHDERLLPGGMRLEQSRWIEEGRVEKRLLIRNGEEAHEYVESVRLFELEDFERMFHHAGLQIEYRFGDYTGEPFDADRSKRLILFAKK